MRQPRVNLLYNYLLSLCRIYRRTAAWWLAGCWLRRIIIMQNIQKNCSLMICRLLVKKVPHLLGSFFVSSSLQSYSGVAFSMISFCQSQSQSYFTTGGLPPISSSWRQATWDPRPDFFFFFWLNSCCNSPYVASSLTRRWVCLSQICLVFRRVYISHI
jgi:hypothetical protein